MKSTTSFIVFLTSDVPCWVPDIILRAIICLQVSGSNGPIDRFPTLFFGLPRFCIMCLYPDVPAHFCVSIYIQELHLIFRVSVSSYAYIFIKYFGPEWAPYTTVSYKVKFVSRKGYLMCFMGHCDSLWVMVTHCESLWVIVSHCGSL